MTEHTRTACPYCGTGCGVIVEHAAGRITGVRGDPDHPANFGRLCTKGSTLHLTATEAVLTQARARVPQVRAGKTAPLLRTAWTDALDLAATRIADAVEQGGPDRVAFYISGQLLTEEYYVFNKLAKGLLGTNNVDTNSRLCMSSAVSGYKRTLGADAPPCCYDDFNHAATLFIAGSNTAYAHPILFRRIEDAKRLNPALRIVVVDPRRTETAEAADLHLQIQPGTDVPLFHAMLNVMLREGWIDAAFIAAHTSGFDALRTRVQDFAPRDVAQLCGIPEADLLQAARWFAGVDGDPRLASVAAPPAGAAALGGGRRQPTLSLWCQGLNQSRAGTDKNAALIGLHLATGQIGKPGAGPFSLTGQPNAMGGREVGGMATLLGGHRELGDAAHRAEVERLWQLDRPLASKPGLTAVELFDAAANGAIDVLWIACTNPAQSMPDQALVRRALQRVPFVIVQDAFATTATAAHADLLLPAATWAEKEGTMTNSERCITRVRAAVPSPGEARDDWRIVVDVARRLEQRLRPHRPTLFPYDTAESIWTEHRATTEGRDLDITGITWQSLGETPAQWPFPAGAQAATTRLYTDGRFATTDGRARFDAAAWEPLAEARDARHPFALNTGRLRDQWHGMSRSGAVPRLFGHAAEPAIEMSRADMERLFVADGDLVRVASRRGQLVLPAQASAALKPMQAFIPMHWGDEFLGGGALIEPPAPVATAHAEHPAQVAPAAQAASPAQAAPARQAAQAAQTATRAALVAGRLHGAGKPKTATPFGVNALTTRVFCPTSKQPELKHAAVTITPAPLRWKLFAMAWCDGEAQALALRAAMHPLMSAFAYAACVPFGRERHGVLFRAACNPEMPPAPALIDRIEALFGLDGSVPGRRLGFVDARRAQRRAVRFVAGDDSPQATLAAVLLAGDARSQTWLRSWLEHALPAAHLGRALLAASATPPVAVAPRSPQVCNCFDVNAAAIDAALGAALPRAGGDPGAALAIVQGELRCGTQCGSCIPELRRMAKARADALAEEATST